MVDKQTAPKYAAEIAERTKEWMKRKGITQSALAEMIKEGRTKVSLFLKGTYTGRLDDIANKLINLLESSERKDEQESRPFVETSVAKAIFAAIRHAEAFCDDEGKIALIVGDGGHGKSHCLRAYANANRNTVYAQLDDAMDPTAMFGEIAKAVGLDASGSLTVVTRRLIESLVNRQIIIILDECSGLRVKHLNQLRQVLVVKARCPLILAGNQDILKTVRLPTTRHGHESLDQFRSRLTQVLNLDRLSAEKGGGGGLYTPEDVRRLYEYGGVKLTSDAVAALQEIVKTPQTGRLRTCHHIIASLHAAKVVSDSGKITAHLIAQAIAALDLPVNVYLPIGPAVAGCDEAGEQIAKTA